MTPKTQKAWVIAKKGVPKDALVLRTDFPVPSKLKKGQVLVKVQAAALNPVCHKFMGVVPNFIAKPLPAEHDLAGVIEDPNGSSFSKGDEVFGFIPFTLAFKSKQGALQEYARLPADHLALRPTNVTPVEASGFAYAGQTAWQALLDCGGLEAGQSVFINGGSSSVGGFAIQIAKAKGASRIVVTASGKNEEYVRSLGADEFIDYTKQPVHEYLVQNPPSTKFDVMFDAVGFAPELYTKSPAYLAPGGTFITVGPAGFWPMLKTWWAIIQPVWLGGVPRTYKMVMTDAINSELKAFADLVAEGKIKPLVDSVYEFDDVLPAYERILSKRATGKLVVKVDPSVT